MRGLMKESIQLCPSQVACEGTTLLRGRTICRPCERALKRREQRDQALRGERHITYELSRRRS
jgi:hypothetical protein